MREATHPQTSETTTPNPSKAVDAVVEGELMHDDAFSVGEKLADELEAAAKTVAPLSAAASAKGAEVAAKVRAAAGVGRALAGHYQDIKATVGEAADAVEAQGVPVRETVEKLKEKVWQTTPLPSFNRR